MFLPHFLTDRRAAALPSLWKAKSERVPPSSCVCTVYYTRERGRVNHVWRIFSGLEEEEEGGREEEGIFQKRKRSFSPYNRCGPFARFIKTKCELGFFPLGVQTCNGFPAYVNCVLCNFRIKCCLVLEQSALVQCNLCIISIPIRSHSSCFLSLSQCCAERPFSEQDKGERREKRKKRPTVWKPKKEIQSATSYFFEKSTCTTVNVRIADFFESSSEKI